MERNFEKYAELGHEKIKGRSQYDLSMNELRKAINVYEDSIKEHKAKTDAVLEVAIMFYHAGVEAGYRLNQNRK